MTTVDDLDSDDLQKCCNVMQNTRNADRWGALAWLKLYAAYKGCAWDLTPDMWTWWQLDAALEHGTVPQWGENEHDPIAPSVVHGEQGDECPHCGEPWIFNGSGVCDDCGGPVKESPKGP